MGSVGQSDRATKVSAGLLIREASPLIEFRQFFTHEGFGDGLGEKGKDFEKISSLSWEGCCISSKSISSMLSMGIIPPASSSCDAKMKAISFSFGC